MKSISLLAIAALGFAGAAAMAQTSAPMQTSPDPSTQTPPPIVVETKVDLTSQPGPPADLHAAREEAVNALHWAKTEGCRTDPSPRDCVRRAQDEYNQTMARLGRR